jgi:eukaryotic-like serine/threonine-protein kinase
MQALSEADFPSGVPGHIPDTAAAERSMGKHLQSPIGETVNQSDFDSFMRHKLFDAIPQAAKYTLYPAVRVKRVSAGERFIRQAEEGDVFYIIRSGKCVVNAEREGIVHLLNHLGPRDIVGEMSVLTGEKRKANVDAETDMVLWEVNRSSFDGICHEFPQLRQFLTWILSNRFSRALLSTDRTIGKYLLEKVIGSGGLSVVYKGSHASLDMPVAVKMLKHEVAINGSFIESFRSEGKTIAQLNHENIVKVYDVEELYRTFFIIMEHVEGVSLKQFLRSGEQQPLYRLLSFLLQICAGLRHAHSRGVVHRDLKPANVLIQSDDTVKIVDFGCACSPGIRDKYIKGTAPYMSPEQITGKRVDERSDIYSLGIMAYEMFTGKKPFTSDDFVEVLNWHLENDVKKPSESAPDIPADLDRVITRATRRDPDKRYSRLEQMLYDLGPLAERMGLSTKRETEGQLNMMSLFLFYREEHRAIMKRLVKEFGRELEKVGAGLRGADFKDVKK